MKSPFLFPSSTIPLHPAQTELIHGQAMASFSGSHQAIGGCLRLTGPLGYGALRRVVDHLPVLFDVFRWQPDLTGTPPQIRINRYFQRPELPVVDHADERDPQRSAENWLQQRFNTPLGTGKDYFDLALLRVSATEHWLLIRGHRLLLDEAGFDQIVRYIAEGYALVATGGKLSELAPAYAEDASAARLYPNSLAYSESEAHWQKQFSVMPDRLPVSRYSATEAPDRYRLTGRDSFCHALKQASMSCQESEESVLLAALTVYFARLARLQTCVFGRVVSGRQTKRQRLTVGQFNRLLPIRCAYKPGQSVRLLTRTIKRQQQYDNSYRHHPMSHIVTALRTTSSHLFDVLLKVLPPAPVVEIAGLNCGVERFTGTDVDVPLQLVWQSGNGNRADSLRVIGQSSFMSEPEVNWMLYQVEQLLIKFAHWPEAAVNSFEVLPPPPKRLFARPLMNVALPKLVSR